MSILNGKTKSPTGQEHATKEHEKRNLEKLRESRERLHEALGDNYPNIKINNIVINNHPKHTYREGRKHD